MKHQKILLWIVANSVSDLKKKKMIQLDLNSRKPASSLNAFLYHNICMVDLYKLDKSKNNHFYANLPGEDVWGLAFRGDGHNICNSQAPSTVGVDKGLVEMGKVIIV